MQYTLNPKSLPCGVQSCYQGEFTRDPKQGPRKSMWGRGAQSNVCTELLCTGRPFPSCAVAKVAQTHPAVVPAPDAEGDDFSDPDENAVAEQLEKAPIGSNEWQGWTCVTASLCQKQPMTQGTHATYARR